MDKLVKEFNKQAQYLYRSCERRFYPHYPWILVRVLPKEQEQGVIILPQNQNKVMYEGIVLEVWETFWKTFRTRHENNEIEIEEVQMKSGYAVGDHIVFPHYEGLPVPHLDEKQYRIVREFNPPDTKCEVVGRMEYDYPTIDAQMFARIKNIPAIPKESSSHKEIIRQLLKDFYIVRKNGEAKTISGV